VCDTMDEMIDAAATVHTRSPTPAGPARSAISSHLVMAEEYLRMYRLLLDAGIRRPVE
jgi:hypothetical protein